MDRFRPNKRLLQLAATVAFTFISTVLVIVGLCTNNWVEIRDRNLYRNSITVHFGLHRVCWVTNDRCNNPGNDFDQQNALPIVQGILITGGFVTVIATLVALFNLLQNQLGKSSGLFSAASGASSCLAGIMLLVGIIIFAVRVQVRTEYISTGFVEYLGFSFGLTTAAGILMIIAAIFGGITGLTSAAPRFNM